MSAGSIRRKHAQKPAFEGTEKGFLSMRATVWKAMFLK